MPEARSVWIRLRNADGVWFSTVTRSCTSRAWNISGERLCRYGTTTTRPPWIRAPHISHTEKSKAWEWKNVHTSSGPNWNQSRVAANRRATLEWVTWQPFGFPVEPDV